MCPEVAGLSAQQMIDAAVSVQRDIEASGYLPGNVAVDGHRVGLGSYLSGVSGFYRRIHSGAGAGSVTLPRVSPRYPAVAHDIDTAFRRMILEEGTIDPEINLESLCRHARLQSWTVKLAHRRSDA
jgi:hypothetical protein